MKNIGVERGLTNVEDFLKDRGYNVSEIETDQKNNKDFIDGFDAVVITGSNNNPMGIETTMAKTSIIEADGLTAEEVVREIERRIK